MPISRSLIHVGLRKSASTYLQWVFGEDPSIFLIHNPFFAELSRKVREAAVKGVRLTATDIGLDLSGPKKRTVVSYEGFTNCSNNAAENAVYIETWASILRGLGEDNTVLILTRAPESWIKSEYNQHIKEGFYASFQQFLKARRPSIVQNLDVGMIYKTYAYLFGTENLLLLPSELLRDDPARFAAILKDKSGITLNYQDYGPGAKSNSSLPPRQREVLRHFNRIFDLYAQNSGKDMTHLPEFRRIIREYVIHYLDDATGPIHHLDRALSKGLPEQEIVVPGGLLQELYAQNEVLKTFPEFQPYAERYWGAEA